jgi:choline dehydrogenase-like flavoprotein
MSAIRGRSGVSTAAIRHNNSNKMLIEGCKNLGYPWETVPQNAASREHNCGWCGFGCYYGKKQSTVMTFLKNARDYGAEFIKECYVERILLESNKNRPKQKKVVGIEAKVQGNRPLKIRCKNVVVAAGAIHSPALLLRSGLKNKHIGKNFHVHPVATVHGVFPETEIKPYEGTIVTTVMIIITLMLMVTR